MIDDTIAAISTPLGEAGLAVIRLSGSEALSIADRGFQPVGRHSLQPSSAPTHTVQYGRIVHQGKVVDEVLLTVLRAPRTFTREDTVEISCHGGLLPAKLVLDTVLAHGARLALPGEFTKRAFLNGRLDLAQAEAVADLIASRTELALQAAHEQLAGKLSQRINELRDQMLGILAHIEAQIDFPDEDIAPDNKEQLIGRLENGQAFIEELLKTASEGQILRRGVRVAIIGRPNVGKSSLLNQLLGHERAIVSATPGTTRDTIEETANIRGLPVAFVDTAGLRDSTEALEIEGMRRSRLTLERSELVLHVLDASEPLQEADRDFVKHLPVRKRILVRNKIDLGFRLDFPPDLDFPVVDVSCLTGVGLEALKDLIKELIWSGEVSSEMLQVMINSRHQNALVRARRCVQDTVQVLRGCQSLELAALDLRIAVNAIGEIVGKTSTEDLLDSIFSQFCIGK
jgi:tRNA modification GTPase